VNKLKIETKTTHIIDYDDWDSYIHKNYPECPYGSIVSEEEMNNYSTFAYEPGKLSKEERLEVIEYLNGNVKKYSSIGTRHIISLLVEDKVLPEGYYNIKIFW